MRVFDRVKFAPCRPARGGLHVGFPSAFGVSQGCLGGHFCSGYSGFETNVFRRSQDVQCIQV